MAAIGNEETMIQMHGVYKSYLIDNERKLPVLEDVSLKIEKGDFVGIMAASGSGKTTLMNLLGCLDRFDSGSYQLDGQNVTSMNDKTLAKIRSHKIGFVFQSFHLLPRLTAMENVELPLLYRRAGRDNLLTPAILLERVGLGDRKNHYPRQLSGGEQQRVAIARALVNDPNLILADEPTGNLDEENGLEIVKILSELNRNGKTIVLVTHDLSVARQANRLLSFKNRNLIQESLTTNS
tara:strand:+ start:2541 stop:3251 length:711 start_codon:yes stop_codon:yes gene_type:complete